MFLDEIAARLVAAGLGVINTTLFLSSKAIIPPGSGPYTTLTETGGTGGERTQNQAGTATARPTAQIAVRASTYAAARAKAKAIHSNLDGVWNTSLSGVFYLSITARQEPTDAGVDEAGRAVVVFNIDCEKQPS